MGALQRQMFLEREAENRKFRDEQEKRNLARMAEIDAMQPSPSIEEIQEAMKPKDRSLKPEAEAPKVEGLDGDAKSGDDAKIKTATGTEPGKYNTRDMRGGNQGRK